MGSSCSRSNLSNIYGFCYENAGPFDFDGIHPRIALIRANFVLFVLLLLRAHH
jgi:hypothetical protein